MPDEGDHDARQNARTEKRQDRGEVCRRMEDSGKREEDENAGRKRKCFVFLCVFPVNSGLQAGMFRFFHSPPSLQFQLGELRGVVGFIELLAADKRRQAADVCKLVRLRFSLGGNVDKVRAAPCGQLLQKQRRAACALRGFRCEKDAEANR